MTNQPELLPETAGDFYTRMDCDGRKWAKELSDTFPSIPMEDAIGWCANMIMQGYDRGYANAKREDNPSWPITPSPATHTQGEVEHSRERFESLHWEERCCFSTPDTITRSDYFMRGKLPSGWRYIDMYVELCWRSWCAALSMQPNTAEAHGDERRVLRKMLEGAESDKSYASTLHQPTEDEAVEALLAKFEKEEPFGDGLEMITSTKGELHTVFDIYCRGYRAARTQVNITEREAVEIIRKAIWNVYDGENTDLELAQAAYRALNRPVGGEK